ncbi:MAG: hypothetical protein ACE5ES_01080 [Candidatus Nanoarchaeia archaeon]
MVNRKKVAHDRYVERLAEYFRELKAKSGEPYYCAVETGIYFSDAYLPLPRSSRRNTSLVTQLGKGIKKPKIKGQFDLLAVRNPTRKGRYFHMDVYEVKNGRSRGNVIKQLRRAKTYLEDIHGVYYKRARKSPGLNIRLFFCNPNEILEINFSSSNNGNPPREVLRGVVDSRGIVFHPSSPLFT